LPGAVTAIKQVSMKKGKRGNAIRRHYYVGGDMRAAEVVAVTAHATAGC